MSHFSTPQGQLDSEVPGVPGLQLSSTVTERHLLQKPTFHGRPTREMPPQNCPPSTGNGREAPGTMSSSPLNIQNPGFYYEDNSFCNLTFTA